MIKLVVMQSWQQTTLIIFALINLLVFLKGFYECKYKKNSYGLTQFFAPLGIFAWGDAVIFGLFWVLAALVSLLLADWYLFLLIVSVFWVIRSLGETIYWFNQQFSSKVHDWNKPENLPLHSVFHNDSIWYIYQIIMQCISVVAIISTLYFAKLWLDFRF